MNAMDKDLHKEVFDQLGDLEVPWRESKSEIWQKLETRLESKNESKKIIGLKQWTLAVAAVLVLLLSTGIFMRFYQETVETGVAENIRHQLPDGSTIEMNAESSLSYHPYWWRFSRKLEFEGEGFFTVQKGEKFTVYSDFAKTEVLGTSFVIYSRDQQYEVKCYTGKVRVTGIEDDQATEILPKQSVILQKGKQFEFTADSPLPNPTPWKDGRFVYTGSSLKMVIDEIKRQYGVRISYPENLDYSYTGEVDVNKDIQTTLDLVCKPFRITFEQSTNGEIIIGTSNQK
jgi:transmembrane sensor